MSLLNIINPFSPGGQKPKVRLSHHLPGHLLVTYDSDISTGASLLKSLVKGIGCGLCLSREGSLKDIVLPGLSGSHYAHWSPDGVMLRDQIKAMRQSPHVAILTPGEELQGPEESNRAVMEFVMEVAAGNLFDGNPSPENPPQRQPTFLFAHGLMPIDIASVHGFMRQMGGICVHFVSREEMNLPRNQAIAECLSANCKVQISSSEITDISYQGGFLSIDL